MSPLVTISIVSHGQGRLISHLLRDLTKTDLSRTVIVLVINIPEPLDFLNQFANLPITVVKNDLPKGFGANHNKAFTLCASPYFCVVNPDIRLNGNPVAELMSAFDEQVGACGPLVIDSEGQMQDSARRSPTFTRLFKRAVLRRRTSDYNPRSEPIAVDWIAGMFIMFRSKAYRTLGGFDERYFMYMEDADIGCRLRRHGWTVRLVPSVRVVHDAQRASHRSLRYLRWHVRSVTRYLTGF
ncbi:glycosyltransferase [Sphingomonas aerolata]|uniref:glycosyltransferase n=1 Tax=Sphingomonas aerolata TaxID=185951 RepID=UPI00208E09D2|nr:glycosyltransferase family 2 protein [Sphingomonas aerolata]USR02298.1 glycosyltransferase family 2 protein [Sphingomonas aerolata]